MAFEQWVHTREGGDAMNRFIRLAIAASRSGVKVGAKEIWERLRWHYKARKAEGEEWRLNNNYTAYAARMAMERVPELRGFFSVRETKTD